MGPTWRKMPELKLLFTTPNKWNSKKFSNGMKSSYILHRMCFFFHCRALFCIDFGYTAIFALDIWITWRCDSVGKQNCQEKKHTSRVRLLGLLKNTPVKKKKVTKHFRPGYLTGTAWGRSQGTAVWIDFCEGLVVNFGSKNLQKTNQQGKYNLGSKKKMTEEGQRGQTRLDWWGETR